MRKIAGIFIVIVLILLLSPWAIGLHLAKLYPSVFNVYRVSGFDVQVLEYQRGWFCSHAKIILTIRKPEVVDFLNEFGLPTRYEFRENIQHGPIIYHPLHGMSTMFGLASIEHQLPNPSIKLGDFIGFANKHFNQIILNSIDLPIPNTYVQMKLGYASTHLWITGDLQKIEGELRFKNFELMDDISSISIPFLKFELDQHGPEYHYLLGKNELSIPQISWTEVGGRTLLLSDFSTEGWVEENKGTLRFKRKVDFEKVQMQEYTFGPVQLELSASQLNLDSIKNMFESYINIQKRGELYQSQLQSKMWMLLPTIVMKDTTLKIEHLNIATPKGKFSFEGKLIWGADYLPENIMDLLQSSDANMNLKISKPLLESWLHSAARMPYFNQASDELDNAYFEARQEMKQNIRLNAFMIAGMTNDGLLIDDDAMELLKLQKENATLDTYQKQLQMLYLNRNILRETNYQLFLGYLEVVRPMRELANLVETQKEDTLQGMHLQWQDWIKAGYIKENGDAYQISLQQKDGRMVISGKGL